MSTPASTWGELRREIVDDGGIHLRTRGSHEIWRLRSGRNFVVVRNHLSEVVPRGALARYRRERGSREPEDPLRRWARRTRVVRRSASVMEIKMKSKGGHANNQRSNTKNPNNSAFWADRVNRSNLGHTVAPTTALPPTLPTTGEPTKEPNAPPTE